MLRLFEFFGGKNSSPIFSTLVRARASSPCILFVGTIKAFNFYYLHFLLRPFLSKIFAGPFHMEKMIEQGKTVLIAMTVLRATSNAMQQHLGSSPRLPRFVKSKFARPGCYAEI